MRAGMPLLLAAALAIGGCSALPGGAGGLDALEARQVSEDAAKMHYLLIRKMLRQGKPRAALAHLDALAQTEAEAPRLRYLRAEIHRQLGDHEVAEREYWGLIEEGRYAAQAHQGLGLVRSAHDPEAAVLHLQEAVRLSPADAELRNDLGYALLRAGRSRAAVDQLQTAVELAPDMTKAQLNLALALWLTGQGQQARTVFQRSGRADVDWSGLLAEAEQLRRQADDE